MKKLLLSLMLLMAMLLSACHISMQEEWHAIDKSVVAHESGFEAQVPSDWSREDGDNEYTLCSFTNPDKTISLLIMAELGAMEYLSQSEIVDQICEDVQDAVYVGDADIKLSSSYSHQTAVLRGEDENGNEIVTRIDFFSPYTSVHYYFVFTSTADAYEYNQSVFAAVAESFTMVKSASDVYQYIQDKRTAEYDELLQDLSEETDKTDIEE